MHCFFLFHKFGGHLEFSDGHVAILSRPIAAFVNHSKRHMCLLIFCYRYQKELTFTNLVIFF